MELHEGKICSYIPIFYAHGSDSDDGHVDEDYKDEDGKDNVNIRDSVEDRRNINEPC